MRYTKSQIQSGMMMQLDSSVPTALPEEPEPNRRYESKDVHVGMPMVLDCPVFSSLQKKPKPVKYGDKPPFKQVSDKLDEVQRKLERIRDQLRQAREGKS
jgi:hypothetical protein